MDAPGLLCCDFGSDTLSRYREPPPHCHIDHLGFRYRLCERHYRGFAAALERITRAGQEGGVHAAPRGRVLRRILAQESTRE